MSTKGIDVSHYQGEIDWKKVKPQIDFAILRMGLGDDIKSQDDKQFERNYSECVSSAFRLRSTSSRMP